MSLIHLNWWRTHPGRAVLLLLTALATLAAPVARAQQEILAPGDANGDGKVDAADAALVIQVAVGLVPSSTMSPLQQFAADVYPAPGVGAHAGLGWGDGKLTVADALAILRKAAGVAPNPWPSFPRPATWTFVQYTLQHSCALADCHDAATAQANLSLDAAHAYHSLINTPSGDLPTLSYVSPGHSDKSYLMTKLTKGPEIVGHQMPWGTAGLASDIVDAFRRWIDAGAPQNGDPIPAGQPIDVGAIPLAGGDVHLDPPPPGQGFQLQWDFAVPVGKEVQNNFYQKLPNDQTIDIAKVEMALSRGSHHFNIFHSPRPMDAVADTVENTFNAINFQEYDLMVDTQVPDFHWTLPDGVVWHLQPHEQMIFQIHYVNATTQQTPGNMAHVKMNFWYARPGAVKYHLGAMFAQNFKTLLPPHSTPEFNLVCPFPQDTNILAITGHYHSRGKTFKVFLWDPTQKDQNQVYESDNWDEPPLKIYDPPIPRKAGQGVDYYADYVNNTDNTIKFGPMVETQEHDNLFLFYYPALPNDKSIYINGR